jgi:hypothetical protein
MQFFNSSQQPWSNSKPALGLQPRPLAGMLAARKAEPCGWYDSSFDLQCGLEVSEQDHDTLYQLWELAQN